MLSGEGNAVRVTILVREVGGVVCAAMEYSVPGPVAQRLPSATTKITRTGGEPQDAALVSDASTQLLEQQLNEAMLRGDEEEVRRLLRLL